MRNTFSRRTALLALTGFSAFLFSRQGTAGGPSERRKHRHACDLILADGDLSVQLVNARGTGVQDVTSILRFRGRPLAILATDADGRVLFRNLTTGLYELSVGNRTEFIRLWESDDAPKSAWKTLVLQQDGPAIGASGPFAALELMGPGGSPSPLTFQPNELIDICRTADVTVPLIR